MSPCVGRIARVDWLQWHRRDSDLHQRLKRDFKVDSAAPQQLQGSTSSTFPALGYLYTDLLLGSGPQRLSVILDTAGTALDVPCHGCTSCGPHLHPGFDPLASTTCSPVPCGASCPMCDSRQRCAFNTTFTEGSAFAGVLYEDLVALAAATGTSSSPAPSSPAQGTRLSFRCRTIETSACP
jgi:hypothetical protein